MRHVELLSEMAPNRTEYRLIAKVSRNLGISSESAKRWVRAYMKHSGKT